MKKIKEIIEIHTNENGDIINLPVTFRYKKITYNKYETKEFNNRLYIVAKDPVLKHNNNIYGSGYFLGDTITPIDCKSCDLLFSLLKLYEKIRETKNVKPNKKNAEYIANWCKKYGLPFQGRLRDINREVIDDLYKKNELLGFSVEDFMSNLKALNKTFSAYLYVKGIDKNRENISGLSFEECKEFLKSRFERLEMFTQFDIEKLEFITVANNLFQAAMYQLMLLTTIKRDKDGAFKEIAICRCCNMPFIQNRRNQKYCSDCSPQKAYKRKISVKKEVK